MANTKPCFDCGDMLERAYTETRDAIRKFILENGVKLENGDVFLTFGDADYCPRVLTYMERRHESDFWEEQLCLALLVRAENDAVLFYTSEYIPAAAHDVVTEEDVFIIDSKGKKDYNYRHWYELDWDMGNSYQHNVERIAFFIGNHYREECEEEN